MTTKSTYRKPGKKYKFLFKTINIRQLIAGKLIFIYLKHENEKKIPRKKALNENDYTKRHTGSLFFFFSVSSSFAHGYMIYVFQNN